MMAFDIHDPETERLVRSLALHQGVSPEEAIRRAVANELKREDGTLGASPQIGPIQDRITVRPANGLAGDKAFDDDVRD